MLLTQNPSYSNKYIGYQTLSFGTRSDSNMIYRKNQPNFKKTLQSRTMRGKCELFCAGLHTISNHKGKDATVQERARLN